ncbi:MAG: glucose-1-phosphate cytidylyltransferase [Gammaproteobacteria bacterium]|nr:glucose-1-phosphate cytidylyltransferase [Gammaproteobacteria bacterium]
MKVIILAGGFGTRLSEMTGSIPKPMIEIGGMPLIWHLMKLFSHFEKNDFIVALGYKSEIIKSYFLQYPNLHSNLEICLSSGKVTATPQFSENWRLELIETGLASMTGGRLLRLKDRIDGTFIFTYGDGLSDININDLVKYHKSHGKLATVTAVKPMQRFGLLKLTENSSVTSFAEKPDYKNEVVNGGYFVLEPQALDYIDGDNSVWEKEPCERLVADGQMMAFNHTGFWQCVDTLHELRILRDAWDADNAQWCVWK